MSPHPDTDSFLPRIRCVFYATFDPEQGPKIAYQVPEGTITTPIPNAALTPHVMPVLNGALPEPDAFALNSSSISARLGSKPPTHNRGLSQPHRSKAGTPIIGIFDFKSIAEYVIPKDQLCGRLVRCNTPSHRIIGFPVKLTGSRYRDELRRNSFRYNLCFVFDRMADISCYEPIVRKVARVLLACEQESGLLSSPDCLATIQPMLEQLYEDLNSYSETSIPIDNFNSIELQIFPFFPNPPRVHDWQVPVALLNLEKRKDPSWDITMSKITPHINGVNHAQRIADLADASPALTRHCLEHLLFYQCIIMIDIFQYSNMYTFKSSIQWLAEDQGVREECPPYVTLPGFPQSSLTDLLHLYSRLKPSKTIHSWMEENNITERGIDPQRFVTFGTIKGFLRRVHRWPVLLPRERTLKKGKNGALMKDAASILTSSNKPPNVTKRGEASNSATKPATRTRQTSTSTPFPNQVSFPPVPIPAVVPPTEPASLESTSRTSVTTGGMLRGTSAARAEPKDAIIEKLGSMLDGSHNSDELCTMFRVSWHELEKYLAIIGGADKEQKYDEVLDHDTAEVDRFGRVRIIYR